MRSEIKLHEIKVLYGIRDIGNSYTGGAMIERDRFATFQREENYSFMYEPGESESRVFPGKDKTEVLTCVH